MTNSTKIRLNKYISRSGYCSRRKADEYIKNSKVFLNNRIVKDLGTKIDPSIDIIRIKNGPVLKPAKKNTLIAMNKPKGFLCTKKDQYANRTVYDLLPHKYHSLFTIGRLDKDTEGLLLFTNDGELANTLAHPRYEKKKKYLVTVRGRLDDKEKGRLEKGMSLRDYNVGPSQVKEIKYNPEKNQSVLEVTITEGKKRQIRNMFLVLKHPVKSLIRVAFGPYELGRLRSGEWKEIAVRI